MEFGKNQEVTNEVNKSFVVLIETKSRNAFFLEFPICLFRKTLTQTTFLSKRKKHMHFQMFLMWFASQSRFGYNQCGCLNTYVSQ